MQALKDRVIDVYVIWLTNVSVCLYRLDGADYEFTLCSVH